MREVQGVTDYPGAGFPYSAYHPRIRTKSPDGRFSIVEAGRDYRIIDFSTMTSVLIDDQTIYGVWSSDSKYFAYINWDYSSGKSSLFVRDGNGSNRRAFTFDYSLSNSSLYWLGRGHYLTVHGQDGGQDFRIVFDVDRGEVVHKFDNLGRGEYGKTDPLSDDFISEEGLSDSSSRVYWDLDKEKEVSPGFGHFYDSTCTRYSSNGVCGFTADGRNLIFQSDRDTKNGGVCSLSSGDATQPYTGPNLFAYMSADNLVADIRAVRTASGESFKLRGTAADANFASYRLDYAPVDRPTDWHPIGVPIATEKLDAELAQWAPSGAGRYLVRLTVEDLAGNIKQATVRVSTYTTPMITDVYKNEDYISPNGDGVQDALQIHYRVLDPGHLSFAVTNSQNQRVRLVERAHTEVDQDFNFVWDGRDDKGLVVPDGKYRVTVLDYDFELEVDNTPPRLTAQLSPRAADKADFAFSVVESNIREMRFEQASRGSEDWSARRTFRQSDLEFYTAQHKGQPGPDFSWNATSEFRFYLDDYFDKLNRAVVVDKAGNVATQQATPGPVELVYGVLQRNTVADLEGSCEPTWGPAYFIEGEEGKLSPLPLPEFGASFVYLPSLFDTLGPSPNAWERLSRASPPQRELNEIAWRTVVAADRIKFPSLKLSDQFFQPLVIHFVDYQPKPLADKRREFRLEYAELLDSWPVSRDPWPLPEHFGELYWRSVPLDSPDYQPTVPLVDPNYSRAEVDSRGITARFLATAVTDDYRHYMVRVVATDEDGTVVYSPAYKFFIGPLQKRFQCQYFAWTITPNAVNLNGDVPANEITIALDPDPYLDRLNPDRVRVTRHLDKENSVLIADEPYRSRPFELRNSTQFFNLSTRDWPTGEQSLSIAYHSAATNGQAGAILSEATATIVVDHSSPSINLISPRDGAKVCMQHERLDSRLVNYLPLEGEVVTKSSAHWQAEISTRHSADWKVVEPMGASGDAYRLRYARRNGWVSLPIVDPVFKGSNLPPECRVFGGVHCRVSSPYQWSSEVSDSQHKNTPPLFAHIPLKFTDISYGENVPAGTDLALRRVVDVETVYGRDPVIDGQIQLLVRAFGPSGAEVRTSPIQLDVDGRVLAEVSLANALFSPNATVPESPDRARITLTNTEPIKVRIDVYAGGLGEESVPTGGLVRRLFVDRPLAEGDTEFEWDGRDDRGQLAADGVYSVVVLMTDDCQNEKRRSFEVELDRTPPVISIVSPMVGDWIGVRTPVTGSVTDLHLLAYRIDFATDQGAALDQWQPLQVSQAEAWPARDLATWRSEVPAGNYVLRVRAQDRVGNVSEVQIPLVKADLQDLLGDLEVSPSLFSPNGDGRLERTRIGYELLQDANVTLDVRNQDGTLVLATLLDHQPVKQGLRYFEWNGLNPANGKPVADGDLVIQITAESASGPLQLQRMRARVRLDASPPPGHL
jgi:flagellar hook assembly protein FlgD